MYPSRGALFDARCAHIQPLGFAGAAGVAARLGFVAGPAVLAIRLARDAGRAIVVNRHFGQPATDLRCVPALRRKLEASQEMRAGFVLVALRLQNTKQEVGVGVVGAGAQQLLEARPCFFLLAEAEMDGRDQVPQPLVIRVLT